ncbi:TPA: hypothetical protein AB5H75_003485 [Vibrio mimicus]
MTYNNCYAEIIEKLSTVETLRIFEFSANNKVQDRNKNLSEEKKKIIELCLEEKKSSGLSFWESLFSLVQNGLNLDSSFLKNAIFHNKNGKYLYYDRKQFLKFISSEIYGDVAINSKVKLSDGSECHIPMLDFKIKSNTNNLKIVKDVLSVLGLRGFILDSGKSYHFVGYELKTESEMIDLLAYFILLHPISDKAWASHQILERSASLRLSKKYGKYPKLVGYAE